MSKITVLILSCLILAACGGGYNPDKEKMSSAIPVGQSSYYPLGQGKGLMSSSVSAVSSGANFEVSFRIQDGGSFSLNTFTDSQLENGFVIEFQRSGDTLSVKASAAGVTQDWSSLFSAIDASEDLTFNVDVHNNEKPAHVMLWHGSKSAQQDHTNTIYNSAEDSIDLDYDNSPGNGRGRQWGFILNQSQILQAQQSSPVDAH